MSLGSISKIFAQFASRVAHAAGRPYTFVIAALIVVVWALTGPIFDFNETWQLVINTGTTIVTFLMVFLIQNAQNRDSEAMQIKLDELLRSIDQADNAVINIEKLDDQALDTLRKRYENFDQVIASVQKAPKKSAKKPAQGAAGSKSRASRPKR